MRKVSRAEELSTTINFHTASDRCEGPNCLNKPEPGASHCASCAGKVANPTSRPYEASKTAGAWPSEVDHNDHISSMETLADHHSKGVAWHSKQGDKVQAGRHAAALAALTGAIEACKIAR